MCFYTMEAEECSMTSRHLISPRQYVTINDLEIHGLDGSSPEDNYYLLCYSEDIDLN